MILCSFSNQPLSSTKRLRYQTGYLMISAESEELTRCLAISLRLRYHSIDPQQPMLQSERFPGQEKIWKRWRLFIRTQEMSREQQRRWLPWKSSVHRGRDQARIESLSPFPCMIQSIHLFCLNTFYSSGRVY